MNATMNRRAAVKLSAAGLAAAAFGTGTALASSSSTGIAQKPSPLWNSTIDSVDAEIRMLHALESQQAFLWQSHRRPAAIGRVKVDSISDYDAMIN